MYPKIIAAGLSLKHAHRSRVIHSLHPNKGKHLKTLHVGKGTGYHKLTDAGMNEVSHVTNKVRRLVPLKIQI
jgi:hypothetical protein